jgi:hypothetical protein
LDDGVKTTEMVAPDSPFLVYEGRWDDSLSTRRRSFWMGSALHARFSGTSFKLKCSFNDDNLPLLIQVDGSETLTTVNYGNASNVTKTLVSGLAPGIHTIKIIRNGSEAKGQWDVTGIELDPGAGLLRHAPHMPRRIEAYGDSTMSGGDGGMFVNYTTSAARSLGASISVISKGGTGVSGGFVFENNGLYYWDRMSYNPFYDATPEASGYPRNPYTEATVIDPAQARGPAWGPGNFDSYGDPADFSEIAVKGRFADSQADAVIIGWGQNDQFGGGPWVSNYRQFVILMKKVYPNAHIFCTHTNMTPGSYIQNAVEPILHDRGPGGLNEDGRVHMLLLEDFPSTSGHPTATQHGWLALGQTGNRGVADWIEETMGWSGAEVNDPIAFSEPFVSPVQGRYDETQTVTISTLEPAASFRYTTDGSWPTPTTGTLYTGPFEVASTATVRAIAYGPGLLDSSVNTTTLTIAAAVPVATPAAGNYTSVQNLTLETATPGAEIRYTTDGSTPSASSLLYSSPISLSATTTLKAIALKTGIGASNVFSGTYTISVSLAATPVMDPVGRNFVDPFGVAITTSTPDAEIRYTTDGSDPSETVGALYSGPVSISTTTILKAVAYADGLGHSDIATETYTYQPLTVATPVISPSGGPISGPVEITLTTSTSGATIRYSTDGLTVPSDTDGTLYTGPFTLDHTAAVSAAASLSGYVHSAVATEIFTLVSQAPAISPASGVYAAPLTVQISNLSAGSSVYYSTDNSTPTESATLYTGPFMLSTPSTVKAVSVGGGYAAGPVASASYTIYADLAGWRSAYGLAEDGSQDLATPADDNMPNLLKYAFAMDPLDSPSFTLAVDGVAGLPRVDMIEGNRHFTFVRRKGGSGSGIDYLPEQGTDLLLADWVEIESARVSVVNIDSIWERVSYLRPAEPPAVFARVGVSIPLPTGGTLFSIAAADGSVVDNVTLSNLDGNGTSVSLAAETITLGSSTSLTVMRCGIYVFELPDLGMRSNPFGSASFTCRLTANGNTFGNFNVDLYGLAARESDVISTADYFTGSSDVTDATKLVDNFVSWPNSSSRPAVGEKTTSAATLLVYLNAQYDGGNGIGKFVFLRLSADKIPPQYKSGTFAFSEHSSDDPRIVYTTAP